MKMSKNKIRKSTAVNEQCFVISDVVIRAIVEEKAKTYGIKLKQKGSSKQNFYARCDHPRFNDFCKDISNLGVIETGKTPSHLIRSIYKSLCKSSTNIINRSRGIKARQLLKSNTRVARQVFAK
jgi:hypothetical protein